MHRLSLLSLFREHTHSRRNGGQRYQGDISILLTRVDEKVERADEKAAGNDRGLWTGLWSLLFHRLIVFLLEGYKVHGVDL